MTWWQGWLVGFDLETTSPDPEEARIVTGAVALARAGRETQTWNWLADPGVEIPEEAAEIHGVTTERARAEGAPAREVVAAILRTLKARPEGAPVVIFNARYDLTVLDREARRHELDPLEEPLVIDPLVIDKWLDRYRKGSRKLDAICEHLGASLEAAHAADSDALAAARTAYVLGRKGAVVRKVWNAEMGREKAALAREWEHVRGDLFLLHEAQRRWAHEQATGLAEYFREQLARGEEAKGDPDGVRTEWPMVPLDAEAPSGPRGDDPPGPAELVPEWTL